MLVTLGNYKELTINYWMALSMMSRIFSGQLRWITASEICIILHILSPLHKYCFITQSNYCSVLNKLCNSSKTFFKSFTYFSAQLQDINSCCFLQILLRRFITSIKKYVLHILAFLPFSFSKKFSYFVKSDSCGCRFCSFMRD